MKNGTAVVLGAGGLVGLGYHVGTIRALEEVGFDSRAADLIIGTSAGSIIGAYLRRGVSMEDLWVSTFGPEGEGIRLSASEREI
ncbi:MAG: hypothetical protein HKL80_10660 [Acidimicrobiales bacterium]|nr:hypothetical protein [Acidimicrobiales bacterium]